ncbi:MAG: DoxX family protein [Proteobacteria bacterium]|nr:DoxX family protein [Pseudomonadota bacterium]NDD03534.1 DoxX family protein [Pseudomonadota bacterium]NDG25995.1 DoxX family protein [Pseudomonadota bacterium]
MKIVAQIAQFVVGLGLLNVWLIRFHQATDYRGGTAKSMKEEFATYGLPIWFCYFVGGLKVISAVLLLMGLFAPGLAVAPAGVVSVLMVGALVMHVKVHDPLKKSVPAACVLALCVLILFSSTS